MRDGYGLWLIEWVRGVRLAGVAVACAVALAPVVAGYSHERVSLQFRGPMVSVVRHQTDLPQALFVEDSAAAELRWCGFQMGPCYSVNTIGGHRVTVYVGLPINS
jgi:hypothetical protein